MFRPALIAGAIAASVLTANAAFAYTIGYVDTSKVLQTYTGAQSAQAAMQREVQNYQQQFAQRQQKIQAAQKAGKSAADIEKLTKQYEAELEPLKERAANLEAKLSANVKTRIEGKIAVIAKAHHVDVVVDKAAVLYGGVDLTADVISALK